MGLPKELASLPPGPELAVLLAWIDRRRLTGADLVRLARARQRLAAHVQAELLRDLYAIARLPADRPLRISEPTVARPTTRSCPDCGLPGLTACRRHARTGSRPARCGGAWCGGGGLGGVPGARPDAVPEAGSRGALPGPRRGVIELQVPLATALGWSTAPAELGGWAPVVADIARLIVATEHAAIWRFSVTDDLGEVVHHGITRARPGGRPAAEVVAFVRARDGTCRAPGCRRPVRTCDVDHTVPRAYGGGHGAENLGALCRKHHRLKHSPGTTLEQLRPGVFGWTMPTGTQYVTTPARPGA